MYVQMNPNWRFKKVPEQSENSEVKAAKIVLTGPYCASRKAFTVAA